jgi:hypothetical protein
MSAGDTGHRWFCVGKVIGIGIGIGIGIIHTWVQYVCTYVTTIRLIICVYVCTTPGGGERAPCRERRAGLLCKTSFGGPCAPKSFSLFS